MFVILVESVVLVSVVLVVECTTMPVNFFTTALFHISEYSHLTHTNPQCKEWIFLSFVFAQRAYSDELKWL